MTHWGRRVRAAAALRGLDLDEVADELHVSRKTLDRTMRGERMPRAWETPRVAEVLGVPEWFIRDGLDGHPEKPAEVDLISRFDRLEALVRGLAAA